MLGSGCFVVVYRVWWIGRDKKEWGEVSGEGRHGDRERTEWIWSSWEIKSYGIQYDSDWKSNLISFLVVWFLLDQRKGTAMASLCSLEPHYLLLLPSQFPHPPHNCCFAVLFHLMQCLHSTFFCVDVKVLMSYARGGLWWLNSVTGFKYSRGLIFLKESQIQVKLTQYYPIVFLCTLRYLI